MNPYATGILSPSKHGKLVANIKAFAEDAGISQDKLWTSMTSVNPTQGEIDYVKSFRRQALVLGKAGLVYVGAGEERDIPHTMALMAACLVRDFIRARVMPLDEVLSYAEDHGYPEHTCLLIPDFHLEGVGKAGIAKYQMTRVIGILLRRQQSGLQTVLHVSDIDGVKLDYGRMIGQHLVNHYHRIDIG